MAFRVRFAFILLCFLALFSSLGYGGDETVLIPTGASLESSQNESPGTGDNYTAFESKTWAIHSRELSDPHFQQVYDGFFHGCQEAAGENAHRQCVVEDDFRIQMCLYQPRSVVNYTEAGFFKTRAPDAVFSLIKEFWEKNKDNATTEWPHPTTYHNNWAVPPTILKIDNRTLPGGGHQLVAAIANAARDVMERWTGQRQASTSVYGIRIYHNQSILAPHVDRLPLVSSAIINVAQDVEQDWPLEVYDHNGVAHNITMSPGDMVFYESHSIIHGRPFPLQGKFFANVFVHFEPIGPLDMEKMTVSDSDLPPYLIEGSSWEPEWREYNEKGWPLLNDAWKLVRGGDLATLKHVHKIRPSIVTQRDHVGWQPIHEAARQGHLDIMEFLLEQGADFNAESRVHNGYTPLAVAQDKLGLDHPVTKLLESLGAVSRGGSAVPPTDRKPAVPTAISNHMTRREL